MENPFSGHFGFLVRSTAREMSRSLARQFAPLAISITEASTMVLIMHNHGVTQSQLCKMLGVKRANMAPLIQNLTHHGWIAILKRDGRSLQLQLTDAGQRLAMEAEAVLNSHEAALLNAVPEKMKTYVASVFEALSQGQEIEIPKNIPFE